MHGPIFVSGMGRSGTTLLEKLLHNHPDLTILSQPAPLLYVDLKRRFLTDRGCEPGANPLGSYFHEPCTYTYDDVTAFLGRHEVAEGQLDALWRDAAGYSGQYHDITDPTVFDDLSGPVALTVQRLLARLAGDGATTLGCKETHCEEFWPYFLGEGWRGVGILRDPRDVITSFSFGGGQAAGGRLRPTLFHVRNWRKSVAFLMELDEHPGFHWLRYEDLITDPETALAALGAALDVDGLPDVARRPTLLDQRGAPWMGNSSFTTRAGIDGSAGGRHVDLLPPEAAAFIEACCGPEMTWAGYDHHVTDPEAAIRAFDEPFRIERTEFAPDFSSDPAHIEQELDRLDDLRAGASEGRWWPSFLSPKGYDRLRACATG